MFSTKQYLPFTVAYYAKYSTATKLTKSIITLIYCNCKVISVTLKQELNKNAPHKSNYNYLPHCLNM